MGRILRTLLYVILLLAVTIGVVALIEKKNSRPVKVVRRAPKSEDIISFKKMDAVSVDTVNPAMVRYFKGGKVGVAFSDGKAVSDAVFDNVDNFYDDVSVVNLDGKYGFMTIDSTYLVEPKYAMAYPFNNGYAVVIGENGKAGIINTNGEEVIKPEYYDNIGGFDMYGHALAINNSDNKKVVIDVKGNVIKDLSPKVEKKAEPKNAKAKVTKKDVKKAVGAVKIAPKAKAVKAEVKKPAVVATAANTANATTAAGANGVEVVAPSDEVEVVSDKEEEVISGNK